MDTEIITGAGGALGVCGWVIWWQSRHIERLRSENAELVAACRADQAQVYARLLSVVTDLQAALGALERAVLALAQRGGGDDGESNGRAREPRD